MTYSSVNPFLPAVTCTQNFPVLLQPIRMLSDCKCKLCRVDIDVIRRVLFKYATGQAIKRKIAGRVNRPQDTVKTFIRKRSIMDSTTPACSFGKHCAMRETARPWAFLTVSQCLCSPRLQLTCTLPALECTYVLNGVRSRAAECQHMESLRPTRAY